MKHLSSTSTGATLSHTDPGSLWRPPDPGVLQINIDGAFKIGSHSGSTAYICCDHTGHLKEGFTCEAEASIALQIEIQALNVALRHLLQIGKSVDPLIIETDCLQVVQAVVDRWKTPWEGRSLLAETAALLPCFSCLQIRFCRREANVPADCAARAHYRGL